MRGVVCVIGVLAIAAGCEEDDPDAWKDDYAFKREGEVVTVYGYDVTQD